MTTQYVALIADLAASRTLPARSRAALQAALRTAARDFSLH